MSNIFGKDFRLEFNTRQLAPISAVPTPLPTWSAFCGDDGGGVGLADGWLTVIGGNPKYGKTIFSIDIVRQAMLSGRRPAFISLEMSKWALATRIYSQMTGVPVWKLEKKGFTETQFRDVWKRLDPTRNEFDLFVDDSAYTNIDQIMRSMEDLSSEGYDFFVVDYIQLAAMGSEDSINKAVIEVVSNLRHFAKAKQVPVVALSQFNRETSKNYIETPQPQGLHGGMIVEASADQIMLIDHSRYERTDKGAMTYMCLTNRHGQHGDIPVEWRWDTLTIKEADPDKEHLWPTNARSKT